MRRIVTVALLAALASAPVPAGADTPGCVSRGEYNRVSTGMTATKVHKIFDTEGDLTGLGAPNQLRYYETCTGRGIVQVVFNPRGRVVSKSGKFYRVAASG